MTEMEARTELTVVEQQIRRAFTREEHIRLTARAFELNRYIQSLAVPA